MFTTIHRQNKNFKNLIRIESTKEFINAFKNYDDIILVDGNFEYKYKKFKDYYIKYVYYNNRLERIEYFNYPGKRHREDGPAFIEYHENGKIKYKSYWLNGKRHREDGPARIGYWKNGKIEIKQYYINETKHRENGPAEIWYNTNGIINTKNYWLNNNRYLYKQYIKELTCIPQ